MQCLVGMTGSREGRNWVLLLFMAEGKGKEEDR